jgi:hypothetical protein
VARRPAIVHLIGFPGAGKYTIAKAVAQSAELEDDHYVVIDNHHTANVIFAALDVDGVRQLPPGVWDRVREVREALLRTIEEISPREWSFVFTNVLTEHDPADAEVVDRLVNLAARRNSAYVPIRIICETEELIQRVTNDDRKERLKWIDPDGVRTFVASARLISLDEHLAIDINVTSLSPTEAAQQVLQRVRSLQ